VSAHRRFALVVVTLVTVASCGIPLDGTPRAMPGEPSGQSATGQQSSGDTQAYVYLVLDDHLVPSPRDVSERTPSAVLRAATQPLSADEASRGLVSQIPKGTKVLRTHQTGDVVAVDLSREFENVIGSNRQEAIGQLVFTATELLGVNELEFTVAGNPVQVSSTYRGDVTRVTACDFFTLLPPPDANTDGLTLEAARHVDLRRQALMVRCPASATSS
jgi:spore germination protein GerM